MSSKRKRIFDYLPEFYEPILPRFFNGPIPSEDLATCETCAMCRRKEDPPLPGLYHYRPDAKCCTYYPSLPNYAIGALLLSRASSMREGKRRIRSLIERRIGAIPHGLTSPLEYDIKYAKLRDRYFGKLHSLLCPYYDRTENNCTIWPFRNSACLTYFCMPVRGYYGLLFWRSARQYLSRLEELLSYYALHSMGWPPDAILKTSITGNRPANDRESPNRRSPKNESAFCESLWAANKYDKEKVYIEAYRIVSGLKPKEVQRLGGLPGLISLEQVRQAYKKMRSTVIPEKLRKNNIIQVIEREDYVYLLLPSQTVYMLREPVWSSLKYFDGKRPYEDVVHVVRKRHNLTLTQSFVLALVRSAILVPVLPRSRSHSALIGEPRCGAEKKDEKTAPIS